MKGDNIMKIKEGFVLREVMGNSVVIATGETSLNFRGMVKLNPTAAEIWKAIEDGKSKKEICSALLDKYEIDAETVENDVEKTIKTLTEQGFIEV